MLKKQYSIRDSATDSFLNALTCINHGEAIRLFTTFVNDEKSNTTVAKYPEQFSLWYLGEFDDQLGTWKTPPEGIKELILGVSVQDEALKKFTVQELIGMIKTSLSNTIPKDS